tara:strand:+ start:695 stop:904 length:210 start_codon:yes stop_codon:yes gene_type:complete
MDFSVVDIIRIVVGVGIMLYVGNCLINQKVWIRKTFSWETKEDFPKVFLMNIIGGTFFGIFFIASPFLW